MQTRALFIFVLNQTRALFTFVSNKLMLRRYLSNHRSYPPTKFPHGTTRPTNLPSVSIPLRLESVDLVSNQLMLHCRLVRLIHSWFSISSSATEFWKVFESAAKDSPTEYFSRSFDNATRSSLQMSYLEVSWTARTRALKW